MIPMNLFRGNKWHRLANGLTVSRLIVIIPFVLCILWWERGLLFRRFAQGLFLFVAISDILDGHFARKGGDNPMGRLLDPLADKICIGAAYLSMTLFLKVPSWFVTSVVVGRFVLLRLLWFIALRASGQDLETFMKGARSLIAPNLLGKISTWAQIILLFLILLSSPPTVLTMASWAVVIVTLLAGLLYLFLVARQIRRRHQLSSSPLERQVLDALARYVNEKIRWRSRIAHGQ